MPAVDKPLSDLLTYQSVSPCPADFDAYWERGLQDNICPPSTQFAAYNAIQAPKEKLVYPDHGHEGLPMNGEANFQFMMQL